MPDKLYRSHSLEKSRNDNNEIITSGSLTVWNDSPVSAFEVGDTFYPVQGCPALTVEKISIKDNVVGELYGKPVRQWEVTIEGSNDSSNIEAQTHVKYNFNISADEKSGTMEVTNKGDNPSLTLDIGQTFSVPGIGAVKCVNVKGSDEYDDDGTHIWTVTYEGSDKEEADNPLPETKYSFSIEKNNEAVVHSGSMQVVLSGDNPSFSLQPGAEFSLPGLGKVKCSKITGSDEQDDNGRHTWTITYEGTDETKQSEVESLPDIKYSFAIEKNGDNDIHTGSMTVVNEGEKPSLSIDTGQTFSIPGVASVTCIKVTGSDEYTETGTHRWTVTYEGSDAPNNEQEESLPETKYSFSIEEGNNDDTVHSGSMSVVNEGNAPTFDIQVGSTFNIPGIGNVTCSKVTGSDDYTDTGAHRWTITYEGTNAPEEEDNDEETLNSKYNFSVEKDSNGNIIHSGSMAIVNIGDNPSVSLQVGGTFNVPGIGEVTCTKFSGSDEYSENGSRKWTVVYEGSDHSQDEEETHDNPANTKYSFSIDTDSNGNTIHSGTKSVTYSENETPESLSVGGTFSIPIIGNVTCTKITGNDEYSDSEAHFWTVIYEGTDAPNQETDDEETLPEVKYNFSIEGEDENSLIHSGTVQVVNQGDAPAFDFGIGRTINVPGIGEVKCTKINGSDEYTDNGTHIWTVTYEGTNSPEEDDDDENLPEIKYSFSIDGSSDNPEHSGSMQVVNEGENPAVTLAVGSEFTIPGVGKVKCTKVSGSDEYTEKGTRRWTVTYEGSNKEEVSEQISNENIKYTFSAETSGDNVIHSGTKQVIVFGDNPVFILSAGDTFSVPGAGSLTCTKYNGSDEFTDDGRHKWTIIYEGTDAPEDEEATETLPETKFNIAIEKDNDGDIQKSGSMSVVSTGDSPALNISVGSTFNIPGIGNVTCSKVTANDDYTEAGTHRWTMTYEGFLNSEDGGEDEPQDDTDTNAKYSFSLEQDSSGNLVQSGSVEISTAGNAPTFSHQVGSTISLPGIGEVTCTKVSGSDSYSDTGKRKWTVVYEGSDKSSEQIVQSSSVKYSLSIENNSDGVTVYSGSKEISCSGDSPTVSVNIGDSFFLPLIGEVTCTRIQSSNDNDIWSVVIEGSRSGGSSGSESGGDDSSLPENETVITYEINGSTARTVDGNFVVLRRSSTPITKKSITVYSLSEQAIALPGDTYEGGIVTSINIIKETIKNNGVVTGSYYKHSLEVEA